MIIKKKFREKATNAIRVTIIYILSVLYALMGPDNQVSSLGRGHKPNDKINNVNVFSANYLTMPNLNYFTIWQSRNWIVLLVLSNRRLWKIADLEFDQISNPREISQTCLGFYATPSREEKVTEIFSSDHRRHVNN